MEIVHVRKNAPLLPAELLREVAKYSAATLHEAYERRGAMDCAIKPLSPGMKICAQAITVKTHLGDNLMLHRALEMSDPGYVIVADTGMCTEAASWGDLMSAQAMANGAAGLVLNGSVRDAAEIRAMGFPVFSTGISMKGLMKDSLGTVNHPICCGGVTVCPGDIVVADDDGVVVIPPSEIEAVLAGAKARQEREENILARIRAGETMYDMMGFAAIFERLGCHDETKERSKS